MRVMMKKIVFMGLAMLMMTPLVSAKNTATPDVVVKNMTAQVLAKLKAKSTYLKQNPNQVKVFARGLVSEFSSRLDLPRMSWSIVGVPWRSATTAQKRMFMNEFKTMLINTYAKSLLKYTNQKVSYLPYRHIPSRKNATVSGYFTPKSGAKVPISYRLYKSSKYGWRVYDVTVAGVSLVTSYKSSFARTLRTSGMAGLIQTIKKKNAKS